MARTSNKREQILNFLTQFMNEHGYAPTVREICNAVGLQSTATVHYHLNALRDAGLTLGWMADVHDLQRGADGQALCARVVGAAVDIGCFEYAPLGGLLFLIR